MRLMVGYMHVLVGKIRSRIKRGEIIQTLEAPNMNPQGTSFYLWKKIKRVT